MGQYSITAGTFGKALAVTPVAIGALDARSAWEFENQSTLGNNYTGSQLYVGVQGNVDVILSGVVGVQDTVTSLNLQPIFSGANPSYAGFAAGSGYFTASNVATTVVSSVHKSPANQPADLTVNITVPLPVLTLATAGQGIPQEMLYNHCNSNWRNRFNRHNWFNYRRRGNRAYSYTYYNKRRIRL